MPGSSGAHAVLEGAMFDRSFGDRPCRLCRHAASFSTLDLVDILVGTTDDHVFSVTLLLSADAPGLLMA
jgi:hypothetical protein